ncbi:hypothetical protein HS088_TW16G00290 [Tripterygium wilfordii]|uniref:Uncharacterized protein n=1 Tax=Tripterygium wilfordii TaxID=458696 RepID=A0A7J7CII1_TRIWF|nr:hypothetical protein HS088_TW16G00290 [Tripterygium wilfordii]
MRNNEMLTCHIETRVNGITNNYSANLNSHDDNGGIEPRTVAAIVVPTVTFIAFLALTCIFLIQRRRKRYQEVENADEVESAWKNWNGGTVSNLIDPTLRVGSRSEMVRCIHIGLLCVQENEASRPTMASVVLMFSSSSVSLSAPLRPAFFSGTFVDSEASASTTTADQSVKFTTNEASITDLVPR